MNVVGFGKNAHKGLLACFENVNLVRRFAAILRHSPLAQNKKKPGFLAIHNKQPPPPFLHHPQHIFD